MGQLLRDNPVTSSPHQALSHYAEQAYLDYAMYVILDRALPFVGDGLKPVQRRILYAMSELGLKATAKYKKSARTIGDVLGKFHPHGESACYETMVLMAQSFSYRYPLIDGQGNWGSIDDPKSFAAMRYTEARLTPYAQIFLAEAHMGAVDWVENFDGTLKEPSRLPAQLPNVLLNGASGIAVGLATDIPPHHMGEITEAVIHLLHHPEAAVEDLLKFVKGPDFPTGGTLLSTPDELAHMYKTGSGLLRLRGRYHQVDDSIIIDQLPYQVPLSRVIKQIAEQLRLKKLPGVIDFRDESDQDDPVRLVIVLKSKRVDCDLIMSHLFATTDMEKSVRVQMNCIDLDKRPKMMSLKDILSSWLTYRQTCVRRRLSHEKEGVLARLHILEGLMLIGAHIDEVIRIIRQSEEPKQALMDRFSLTDIQAQAILEIRLKQLAKVEYLALEKENNELKERLAVLESLLSDASQFKAFLAQELEQVMHRHVNPRRTILEESPVVKAQIIEQPVLDEPVTVILSQQDWIRSAKGHDIDVSQLVFRPQDKLKALTFCRTKWPLILLSQTGRVFNIPISELPSVRTKGEPLAKWLKLETQDPIIHTLNCPASARLICASTDGYGFMTRGEDCYVKQRAGKSLMRMSPSAQTMMPLIVTEKDEWLALLTAQGRLLIIPINQIPELKGGKGNKLLNIRKEDFASQQDQLVAVCPFKSGDTLRAATEKRYTHINPDNQVTYQGDRGRRGQFLPRGFRASHTLTVISPETDVE